ncbi:MAG: hypothetical protein KatS3mg108_0514 [Isosphaeraceae bacterium]|jgi:hypothetical protein|nr:MAG: hypothetical protein KatS3mg108_0514 [Isosphaeraceae bacterium]
MGQRVQAPSSPPTNSRLNDSSVALALARAIDRGVVAPDARARLLAAVNDDPRPEVRDLFERFRPTSERAATLGGSFDPSVVLRLAGDPDRGRLFRENSAIPCRSCQAVEGFGQPFRPDLAKPAATYDRRTLLEHILKPSLSIDEPYRAHVVETTEAASSSPCVWSARTRRSPRATRRTSSSASRSPRSSNPPEAARR